MASPEEQTALMISRLPELTGHSLDEWKGLIAKSGLTAHGKIVAMLKAELVAAQYAGARSAVKPIYDAVLAQVAGFGADVEVAPKKAYVSLRRATQFALLQPAASRLDVGIKLPGTPPTARLEASGSFNSMVSHRVRVASAVEVDAQLIGWLRQAYDRAD